MSLPTNTGVSILARGSVHRWTCRPRAPAPAIASCKRRAQVAQQPITGLPQCAICACALRSAQWCPQRSSVDDQRGPYSRACSRLCGSRSGAVGRATLRRRRKGCGRAPGSNVEMARFSAPGDGLARTETLAIVQLARAARKLQLARQGLSHSSGNLHVSNCE